MDVEHNEPTGALLTEAELLEIRLLSTRADKSEGWYASISILESWVQHKRTEFTLAYREWRKWIAVERKDKP